MKSDHLYKLLLFVMIAFSGISSGYAQQKYTLSGYLKDASNGETLIGATLYIQELKAGTITNAYGFYSLTVPEGNYTVNISYIGYVTVQKTITLNQNQNIDVELEADNVSLQEVQVTDVRLDENIESVEMSVNKMDINTIKSMPALLGEVDVIRSIQLLPGVTTVGEGATGFNVRGGSIDQNLVLLDEAPVYNSAHALGFFSIFNPDAVKDVKLIKGGIPAQYGGRLSSILDVRLKEGNAKKFEMNGGVGLIFSRLTLEAPIIKDKASFLIAARRSYIDLFFPLINNPDIKDSKVSFYDLTAKLNYTVNAKNKIFLSGYFGRDILGFSAAAFNWGNATATFRWNHLFNDRLFFNLTAFYSNYDYKLSNEQKNNNNDDSFSWKSRIINYSVKPEFTWFLNTNNTISFGGQAIYYQFVPGTINFKSGGDTRVVSLPDKYALESAIYISNEQNIGSRLSLQYGLRFSWFNYLGKGEARTYGEVTTPGIRRPFVGTQSYDSWQSIQQYQNLEPRFSAKYTLDKKSSVKLSYNRMVQYIHLISNTTASIPLDVWTPSTNNIKPQIADQIALGYFRNFGKENAYEFSIETYYKAIQNQIDYINGADLLLNKDLEGDLLSGVGRAYGLELYLKKNTGKFTGWASYTLSRTETQVNGINNNNWYPTRFDKLSNLYLVGLYELNKKWSFSANFVLSTGTPATFPTNKFVFEGISVPHDPAEGRNNYRIPAYHRLDIAVTLNSKKNDQRKWKSSWVFSVYNVYGYKNPFSVYFQQNPDNSSATEAIKFVVVGYPIPAVTYNFKF